MLKYGDVITLDNDKRYVVASTCTYKEKEYAYIVNVDDEYDVFLGEVSNDDFILVDDTNSFKEIMPYILENVDDSLLKYSGDINEN